ncbi:MAG: hypothetical protein ABSC37_06705 [Xanthobacteraceae bacterium]
MNRHLWAVGVLALAWPAWVSAQTQTVERTAKGQTGKDIQIGVYVNVLADCTSGPLPTIRLSSAPAHGKIVVKRAKASATNFKQCLAFEVPAFVAMYRSQPAFSGTDVMIIEVKYPGGRSEIQRITVEIGPSGSGQPI